MARQPPQPSIVAKLDARLCERLERGDEPLEVAVTFRGLPPPVEELVAFGLARFGDAVVGRVSRAQLEAIAARDDVTLVEGFGDSYLL